MPKKTRQEKIKSDQRRHHFSFAPPAVHTESSPNPKYSLPHVDMQNTQSKEITAMIDPSEFRLIKLDLLKTTILAIMAFMTEFWLYMRLGQK